MMMKANQKMAVLILFSAIIMAGVSLSSYAGNTPEYSPGQNTGHVSPPGETTTANNTPSHAPPSNGKGAAKGCATGAAIGTAIAPGAGTLAGCIIAGIWGWFW
ncbi:MAG: hypothetical protein GXP18_08915 [Gammaproteobacteria bacterium]|nr:hypothetical protein [Gammaproteobacteria bacterium]